MSFAEHWPTAVDYQTALQTPALCFNDLSLKQGGVFTDTLGLPLVATGNVVVVFRMRLAEGDAALRCFTRKIDFEVLAHRYRVLSVYVDPELLPALVPCIYWPDEVLIGQARYPVVQMPWVPGLPLHRFVEAHLHQPDVLNALADHWRALMAQLSLGDFAHGDLSDGNVLVDAHGTIRLIDYDGAYVPMLQHDPPAEVGKPNYQHPGRLDPGGPDYGYYGPNIDAFSALVIYLSLRALADDPERWRCYHSGENLIFDKDDFRDPGYTPIWLDLRNGQSNDVKRLADVLDGFCHASVADLPDLEDVLQDAAPGRHARVIEAFARADEDDATALLPQPLKQGEAEQALPEKAMPKKAASRTRSLVLALAGMSGVAALFMLFTLFARPGHDTPQHNRSLVWVDDGALPLPPEDLAGFYTGYATSLEGDREPMALIIDSVAVDSARSMVRFAYSVNWKAHHIRGIGQYARGTGRIDLESHYELYVARASADEVVLASVSNRDHRPLVMINKRRTP